MEAPFYISDEALRRHVYLIGKTGTGKTTLLKSILFDLIEHGQGAALLDPHGEVAAELLGAFPSHLATKLVYFNPGDLSYPVAWNILADVPIDERPRKASAIVSAFKHAWSDSWGPRLEYILTNAVRALLDAEHTSLLGLPKMLTDSRYRKWVVEQIDDPFVKSFWEEEFENYDARFRQEAIAPIQNKIGQLVSNPVIRNILGQVKCKLDIRFIMDNGYILIANLSKGVLGEGPSNLIGSLLISEFQTAAMARIMTEEEKRRDFTLIIDEFQNFGTDAFTFILSEARKFFLSLVLCHQFLSQTKPNIRDAVLGNMGTIVAFQLGSTDAEIMAKEFGNTFAESHFVDLEKFHILVKPCSIDGIGTFRGRTEHASLPCARSAMGIIRYSQERYGSPRAKVEDKIRRWLECWNEK